MSTAKEELLKILNEFPESEITKVLDFAEYIRDRQGKRTDMEMIKASESSLGFWNNEKDDEVWNDV